VARAGVTAAAAIVYRLYDVGYEIHLDRALDLLATNAPERVRPVRGEAQAIQIKNPPISVLLGSETVMVAGRRLEAEVSARIFDFGVVSIRLGMAAPQGISWSEFSELGNRVDVGVDLTPLFAQYLRLLLDRIKPAVERPAIAPVTEDYVVFRISQLTGERGEKVSTTSLRDEDIIPLLLNERRELSQAARRELLPHRFSYYGDDLTILTWDNALIIEPANDDSHIQYILEFANAQLLELRVYDAILDGELPKMYDRIASKREGARRWLDRRYAPLLNELQTLVADSTELVERVENSLKVTDDVYLARVYTAALEIFRGREWRQGIDRKLAIIRETYAMLNAESQARRSEALELAIVVLIVLEILLAIVLRR
jgi:virulence-associated protein VagC